MDQPAKVVLKEGRASRDPLLANSFQLCHEENVKDSVIRMKFNFFFEGMHVCYEGLPEAEAFYGIRRACGIDIKKALNPGMPCKLIKIG